MAAMCPCSKGGFIPKRRLLKLKPAFAERGRILIGHYIKFEDIFEWVIEGLDAVGMEVCKTEA